MRNKMMYLALKAIAKAGFFVAFFSANMACNGGAHQDELPKSVKQLRKF